MNIFLGRYTYTLFFFHRFCLVGIFILIFFSWQFKSLINWDAHWFWQWETFLHQNKLREDWVTRESLHLGEPGWKGPLLWPWETKKQPQTWLTLWSMSIWKTFVIQGYSLVTKEHSDMSWQRIVQNIKSFILRCWVALAAVKGGWQNSLGSLDTAMGSWSEITDEIIHQEIFVKMR